MRATVTPIPPPVQVVPTHRVTLEFSEREFSLFKTLMGSIRRAEDSPVAEISPVLDHDSLRPLTDEIWEVCREYMKRRSIAL